MRTIMYDLAARMEYATDVYDSGVRINAREEVEGLRAVFTTYEGDRLVGVLEIDKSTVCPAPYMMIRFPDGKWGSSGGMIELIVSE